MIFVLEKNLNYRSIILINTKMYQFKMYFYKMIEFLIHIKKIIS